MFIYVTYICTWYIQSYIYILYVMPFLYIARQVQGDLIVLESPKNKSYSYLNRRDVHMISRLYVYIYIYDVFYMNNVYRKEMAICICCFSCFHFSIWWRVLKEIWSFACGEANQKARCILTFRHLFLDRKEHHIVTKQTKINYCIHRQFASIFILDSCLYLWIFWTVLYLIK